MFLRVLEWNVEGIGSKEREVTEQINKNKQDLLIITELKANTMAGVTGLWPGAKWRPYRR